MGLSLVEAGRNAPHEVNVVIEIPLDSQAVKYEVDKDSGAIFVDRVLSTAMRYPCNYGYVPRTLCGDGDPVDVLVVMPVALIPGSVVRVRPIGMLKMRDEAGDDTKLIAVPIDRVSELYAEVESVRQLPKPLLAQIEHFFLHYKDLEKGKWVRLEGWAGADEAKAEIVAALARYQAAPEKPKF